MLQVKSGFLDWSTEKYLSGSTENHTEYTEQVSGLRPNTLYAFRLRAHYRARPFDKASYLWPQEETRFTHKTLGKLAALYGALMVLQNVNLEISLVVHYYYDYQLDIVKIHAN